MVSCFAERLLVGFRPARVVRSSLRYIFLVLPRFVMFSNGFSKDFSGSESFFQNLSVLGGSVIPKNLEPVANP